MRGAATISPPKLDAGRPKNCTGHINCFSICSYFCTFHPFLAIIRGYWVDCYSILRLLLNQIIPAGSLKLSPFLHFTPQISTLAAALSLADLSCTVSPASLLTVYRFTFTFPTIVTFTFPTIVITFSGPVWSTRPASGSLATDGQPRISWSLPASHPPQIVLFWDGCAARPTPSPLGVHCQSEQFCHQQESTSLLLHSRRPQSM